VGFEYVSEPIIRRGIPADVEVTRGPMRLWLSEWESDRGPTGLVFLALKDADLVREKFGADDDEGVFELTDPDGNRFRVVQA
jgi:hypothetical protein